MNQTKGKVRLSEIGLQIKFKERNKMDVSLCHLTN